MPAFAPVPFGEWRPDIATLDSEFATEALNVFPGPNSYKPMPSLAAFVQASLASTAGGNDSSTKILLHCDGADATTTFTDSNTGGSAHTWTAAGNAQIDTAQSKFGGASGLFDGTGDWVTTPDHADFTLGSGDWTIDLWLRTSSNSMFVCGQGDGFTATNRSATINIEASGVARGHAFVGSTEFLVNGVTAVNDGAWHHIAFVRTGNTLKLFTDGTQEGGDVSITGTVNDSTTVYAIGTEGSAGFSTFNGWIDEFRLSNTARWTSNFTPPSVAYFTGGKCVGMFAARKADNSWKIYAGTLTRLFTYDSSAAGWVDVTRTSGGNYNVPNTGDLWSFAQFGTFLYACNINDVLQRINVDSGTNFAAVAGSPPQARTVTVIGDFLVLAGLSSNNRVIQWSAINDPTGWTVGTNLSDQQEFPEGGPVMTVAGSEIGYVCQERCIRTMQFLPGDTTLIFTFSRVLKERGCVSPYGATTVGNTLYFPAEDGFYALLGQQVFTIGQDKVNDWFASNSDPIRRGYMQVISAIKPFVFWAYYTSSASSSYNGVILFDWNLQKWARTNHTAECWGIFASLNLDLDTTGSEPGDSLLDSTASSLDSPAYVGGRPVIVGMVSGILSALNGPAMQATIETGTAHLTPGYRTFISSAYPLCEAGDGTITVSERERLQDTEAFQAAVGLTITGSAPVFSSARLHRFRYTAPAASTWNHAIGIQVEGQQDGSTA